MEVFYSLIFFIFGTILGSFYNVVGLRLPKHIPFSTGRSYCPSCKKTLRYYELIPVLSYVLQGGKCRSCGHSVSFIYPFIEVFTGILFAFTYIKLGPTIELIVAICLISMLAIIFVSDMTYMLIPNKLLLFFLPIFIILRIIEPLTPWHSSITGAIVGFVLLAFIIIASKGGMGAGDMKLFGVLGLVLGLKKVLLTFFLASLFGALLGGVLILLKIINRKQAIPFGPYIVLAALISYFYGDDIISLYNNLLF